jgi:hypothetical protein
VIVEADEVVGGRPLRAKATKRVTGRVDEIGGLRFTRQPVDRDEVAVASADKLELASRPVGGVATEEEVKRGR